MNATEKLALRALLEAISQDGITILLIEHDVKLVLGCVTRHCARLWQDDRGRNTRRSPTQCCRHRSLPRRSAHKRGNQGISMSAASGREGASSPASSADAARPAHGSTETVLNVRGLKVAYGGIQAVKGVDLEVRPGELVTLIGANGAGKTTTLKAITGTQSWTGEVDYMGASTKGHAPYQLLGRGLTMVPEGRGVFARMSVTENLQMGAFVRKDSAGIRRDIDEMFAIFPRLKERAKQLAGTFPAANSRCWRWHAR